MLLKCALKHLNLKNNKISLYANNFGDLHLYFTVSVSLLLIHFLEKIVD